MAKFGPTVPNLQFCKNTFWKGFLHLSFKFNAITNISREKCLNIYFCVQNPGIAQSHLVGFLLMNLSLVYCWPNKAQLALAFEGWTGFFIISPNREQPSVTECRFGVGRVQALFLVLCPFQKIHLSFFWNWSSFKSARTESTQNNPMFAQQNRFCCTSAIWLLSEYITSEDKEGKRSTVQLHTFETKLGLQ